MIPMNYSNKKIDWKNNIRCITPVNILCNSNANYITSLNTPQVRFANNNSINILLLYDNIDTFINNIDTFINNPNISYILTNRNIKSNNVIKCNENEISDKILNLLKNEDILYNRSSK